MSTTSREARSPVPSGFLYAISFIVVTLAFGLVHSAWVMLALPASVLIGFGFAAIGMAATSYMRSWQDFEFVQLAVLPLFLLSATFYPLSTYPRWLQLVTECTPLFHGVALLRALNVGAVGPGLLVQAAYFVVMGVVGVTAFAPRCGEEERREVGADHLVVELLSRARSMASRVAIRCASGSASHGE